MNVPEAPPSPERPRPVELLRRAAGVRSVQLGLIIALVVLAGVVIWALAGFDTSSKKTGASGPAAKPIEPVALSAEGLATLARAVGQPIYWAGAREGYSYELERTANGSVHIRYLPPDVEAGGGRGKYLTIATYPFRGALEALKNVTSGRQVPIPGGGIALVGSKDEQSVHLAYPGVDFQVEVYDPSPARARAIATSGRVRPVR